MWQQRSVLRLDPHDQGGFVVVVKYTFVFTTAVQKCNCARYKACQLPAHVYTACNK